MGSHILILKSKNQKPPPKAILKRQCKKVSAGPGGANGGLKTPLPLKKGEGM